MAWDIYGNRLERGCCEVHPWVSEEYPCSLCETQTRESNRLNDHYNQVQKEWADAVEAEHRHYQYMEFSEEYRTLHIREEKIKKILSEVAKRKAEVITKLLP